MPPAHAANLHPPETFARRAAARELHGNARARRGRSICACAAAHQKRDARLGVTAENAPSCAAHVLRVTEARTSTAHGAAQCSPRWSELGRQDHRSPHLRSVVVTYTRTRRPPRGSQHAALGARPAPRPARCHPAPRHRADAAGRGTKVDDRHRGLQNIPSGFTDVACSVQKVRFCVLAAVLAGRAKVARKPHNLKGAGYLGGL